MRAPVKSFIILALSVISLSNVCFAKGIVNSIRVWPSPGSTRVVFDLDKAVEYELITLDSPNRVVIDLKDTDIDNKIISSLELDDTMIKAIRTGHREHNITRIVFELDYKLKPNAFLLQPNERYGDRLVLDLESSEKQSILALFELDDDDVLLQHTKSLDLPVRSVSPSGADFVVAIDCGHGGEDPGAIGHLGTKEKDVVLAIGKKLKRLINQQKGMRAILTRGGDYYVALRDRFERARTHNADLFISIHADAFKNKKATGASVFILSDRGATSEAAKWIADKENRSDLVGGISLDDKGDLLASVLLDLSQTASNKASFDAAKKVLDSIGQITDLHKNHVEKAGFLVLKAPDVPSMLVETGFISNPKTEKKLRSPAYQEKIAKQIFTGVKEYYDNFPQHRHHAPVNRRVISHEVKKGDTLSEIAHRYKTTVASLKQENNLRGNNIHVGQKLRIVSYE